MVVGAKAMTARRFPAPWSAEPTPNCFIVRDVGGQALSYDRRRSGKEKGRRVGGLKVGPE
jgi:hypothetical protein